MVLSPSLFYNSYLALNIVDSPWDVRDCWQGCVQSRGVRFEPGIIGPKPQDVFSVSLLHSYRHGSGDSTEALHRARLLKSICGNFLKVTQNNFSSFMRNTNFNSNDPPGLSKVVKHICWFYINVYKQDGCRIILAINQQKIIVICLSFKKSYI